MLLWNEGGKDKGEWQVTAIPPAFRRMRWHRLFLEWWRFRIPFSASPDAFKMPAPMRFAKPKKLLTRIAEKE